MQYVHKSGLCPAPGNPLHGHQWGSISYGSSRSSGAQRHLSARWYGSPLLLVCTGELEPEAGPWRSIKRLPKQPENPCEDAGLLGSIKAQRASKRHNQCLTRASSPGGVKTKAQNRALFGSDSWSRDLARTARPVVARFWIAVETQNSCVPRIWLALASRLVLVDAPPPLHY